MKLLKQLTDTPSVPGREGRVRDVILEHIKKKKLFDKIHVDAMGSLHGVRHARGAAAPKNPKRVMLAAHMDQIGFLVCFVSDQGYLRVNPVGGFDMRNLFARRVTVCTAKGDLPGVMNPAGKPIHIASAEERKKVPEIEEFYVDLGMTGAEAKKKVKIGDMVVLNSEFGEVGNTIVSQCMDNRVGCWAVIRAMEKLKTHSCEIHAVWTVQEEVGLRGAGPAAFAVAPDLAISCDTTLNCEIPGVPVDQRVTAMGEGVCLKIMDSSTIADLGMLEDIERVAKRKKIKCQRGVLPRGGQDGAMMQRGRAGCKTAVFACPVKNIHTVVEMCHKDDLASYPTLLAAYLGQVK